MDERRRCWLWNAGIPLLLVLVTLLPRVVSLGALTNPDELGWLNRSALFYDALSKGDWAATLQAFHPGVVPMWGFGGFMLARYGLGQLQVWLAANALPMADLAQAALFFPILVSVLTVLAVYGLVRRLAGREIGLYAALMLAFEPYYMAFTHAIHMDLTHASLMLVAALFWINYLYQQRRWPYLVGSGLVSGFAVLTRSASLYLVPFSLLAIGIYFLVDNVRGNRPRLKSGWQRWIGRTVFAWIAWLGLLLASIFVLWPALWVEPVSVMTRLAAGVFRSVENAHPAPAFFLGKVITGDPGVAYYWLILLFRLQPLTLIMAILNPLLLVVVWRRLSPKKRAAWLLGIGYAACYFLQMSLAAHKLERYMVPVVVVLAILAAVSLAVIVKGLAAQIRQRTRVRAWIPGTAIISFLIGLLAIPWLRLMPDYSAYFNPLVGGGQRAVDLFTVGSGLGLDQAAAYLNDKPNAADMMIPSFYHYVFQYYFTGHTQRMTEDSWAGVPVTADYVVLTLGQAQRDVYPYALDFFLPQQPEYTIRINDIEYAWVYRVPRRELASAPPIHYPLSANFEGRVLMHGFDLGRSEDELLVTLYWQPLTTMHKDLWVTLRLEDEAGQPVMQEQDRPWSGDVMVFAWPEGLAVRDTHTLLLPDNLPQAEYNLIVALSQHYDDGNPRQLPLVGGDATELQLGPVNVGPLPAPSQSVADGNLGGMVRLVGYDPPQPLQATAGATLPLTLTWEVMDRLDADYTVFVHMVDADGRPVSQVDSPPLSGANPTSFWKRGERIVDSYALIIPPQVPAGEYELLVGMYLLGTGERLPVVGSANEILGDSISLGTLTVHKRSADATFGRGSGRWQN